MDGVSSPSPPGAYWVNGEIVAAGVAAVSPVDHAIIVGDGVFETLKVVDGVPFALTRHLGRLKRSADGLGLPEPDEGLMRNAVAETLGDCASPGQADRVPWGRTGAVVRARCWLRLAPEQCGPRRYGCTYASGPAMNAGR